MKKLRVQLTDACNFRCFYCMPDGVMFTPNSELLTPVEYERICGHLVKCGVEEFRLSGGEPTLRADFLDIVYKLSALPVQKMGLTTNAYRLDGLLDDLKKSKCHHINISLDSLNDKTFEKITRSKLFSRVYDSVLMAKSLDFEVKVNVVLMKGVNDHEVFDFIDFSSRIGIEVRFLELMKIGPFKTQQRNLFISAQEIMDRIESYHQLNPIFKPSDSTSFNFTTSSGAKIGFIASESQPFCSGCSRLRLSAKGHLRACIMSEAGVNIRNLQENELSEVIERVVAMKPTYRIDHIEQPMVQIGG
ncbi:MAG: radical SAM protein [Candidatus Omnitrophica bacterium]|nr:radical SAM protein [Candidatus Omnitrophota bacterium]